MTKSDIIGTFLHSDRNLGCEIPRTDKVAGMGINNIIFPVIYILVNT